MYQSALKQQHSPKTLSFSRNKKISEIVEKEDNDETKFKIENKKLKKE